LPPTKTLRIEAQIRRNGPPEVQLRERRTSPRPIDPNAQSIAQTAAKLGVESVATAANPILPQRNFGQPGRWWWWEWRPPVPERFMKANDYLEAWRAWQRRTGRTDPPIRPLPGRRPPNFFGWRWDRRAPATILIPSASGGTVHADGQNVVIAGVGFANITQAYSV
jgi:hypothetical protein